MTLKHLSLCTGYGGLDLAVEALLDTELVALAEFDQHAAKICETRFPGVPNLHDIKTVDWEACGLEVDLITAGYPCQPFSLAGKRKGTDDDRHLWPYIAEAIRHLRPGVVVLENVYGHLSKGFGDVLGTLASLGYDARWNCVRASDVGAPHKRERVFIVATDTRSQRATRLAGSVPRAAQEDGRSGVDVRATLDGGAGVDVALLPTPEGSDGSGGRVSADLGGKRPSGAKRAITLATAVHHEVNLLPTPTANEANGAGHAAQGGRNLRTEVASLPESAHGDDLNPDIVVGVPDEALGCIADEVVNGGNEFLSLAVGSDSDGDALLGHGVDSGSRLGDVKLLPTPTSRDGKGANQRNDETCVHGANNGAVDFGKYAEAVARWEALTRPAPAPSEIGPKGNRRLNPPFVEWMMGLPEGWVTDLGLPRTAELKILGNGVVWQQAAFALAGLL